MNQHDQPDRALTQGFADVEELIAYSRHRQATGFPNPQRVGCPPLGTLAGIVHVERLPDEELQAHLFGCSECFNEYRTAVLAQREAHTPKWQEWLTGWRGPVFAGACALLLFTVGMIVWRTRHTQPHVSQTRPQPATPIPLGKVAETTSDVPPTLTERLPGAAAAHWLALNRDLNDHRALSAQRRGGGTDEAAIELPRTRLRLRLSLRDGSATGTYRVSVLDAVGRTRATDTAHSREGRTLVIMLDLRRTAGKEGKLRIERLQQADVAPEEYKVHFTQP